MWPYKCTAHLSFHTRNWLKQANGNVGRINTIETSRSISARLYKCSEYVVRLLLKAIFFFLCVCVCTVLNMSALCLVLYHHTPGLHRIGPTTLNELNASCRRCRHKLQTTTCATDDSFFFSSEKSGNGDWCFTSQVFSANSHAEIQSYTSASAILEVNTCGRKAQWLLRVNCV